MKSTDYYRLVSQRPDRAFIEQAWIERVLRNPEYRMTQSDGRIRCWGRVPEHGNRYLRVVLLPDGETVHNAFFDRGIR